MEPDRHQHTAVGTAVLTVSNGFFELLDSDGGPDVPPDATVGNGLVAPGSTGANILTGLTFGPVRVTVEIHRTAPPLRLDGWHDIVETTLCTTSGKVSACVTITGDNAENLPAWQSDPDSWFRIRAHARGRAIGPELTTVPAEPPEDYLLQMWPSAGPEAEIVHRRQ